MSTSPIERLLSIGKPHAKREVNERRAAIARRMIERKEAALKAATLPPRAPRKPRAR